MSNKAKLCGTCKYFTPYTDAFDLEYHGAHAGRCSCDKFVENAKVPVDGLGYWDYESYSAGFEVGAGFGCIHWMAR
jgi:hypothetical protein